MEWWERKWTTRVDELREEMNDESAGFEGGREQAGKKGRVTGVRREDEEAEVETIEFCEINETEGRWLSWKVAIQVPTALQEPLACQAEQGKSRRLKESMRGKNAVSRSFVPRKVSKSTPCPIIGMIFLGAGVIAATAIFKT
ncbi:hypothetical protein BHYA_0035g00220 [Botrytis hyacinthi]|uniref:Uncharacterized protein n=1 Tax=Botrytis hyacinthi TaxID=278943 RepID=A0A4Z1GVU6_9HELO|nr:hypothetical protein BHYA_0035g00220 [Botrytis hyacinthi]